MNQHRIASAEETPGLDSKSLRNRFLLAGLFKPGEVNLTYTDLDRAIVGGICPDENRVRLNVSKALRSNYFFERREGGVLNIGDAPAQVEVNGEPFTLETEDCLYIGRGSKDVYFSSQKPGHASCLYFVSFPAHVDYPTAKATPEDARKLHLGSGETANERILYQYIHEEGLKSCQLVMGFTKVLAGSVWNTMPPHTHERRCEIYLYYTLNEDEVVFHLMGEPQETRHLVLRDRQVVLSPPWSIHAGCGTSGYNFVWAMGGENQRFDDMDPAEPSILR